eukprot:CAMPEP_0170527874 /NCGR_PEP_ID=MMETSP0209-20121228/13365_1 /TAXON_ID=665100 ORGANISM="Litonotus pictus, Strain P1" /NCGR_SAMPLE_ID=MMETSP0209 /ASSEMBLY_ACC=CAM_ASM_000301 /LENGTH=63 /DNA_ID=CAMNT_0010818721 /DNA_START=30 /DNA_END=218 /DNA_ORIENTATION=-
MTSEFINRKANIEKEWREFYPGFRTYLYLFKESSIVKNLRKVFDQLFLLKTGLEKSVEAYFVM